MRGDDGGGVDAPRRAHGAQRLPRRELPQYSEPGGSAHQQASSKTTARKPAGHPHTSSHASHPLYPVAVGSIACYVSRGMIPSPVLHPFPQVGAASLLGAYSTVIPLLSRTAMRRSCSRGLRQFALPAANLKQHGSHHCTVIFSP